LQADKKAKILTELEKVIDLMEVLRSPDGCPWDREQNYDSLTSNIIEEAYEVVEAIKSQDINSFKEELGDLLLQVIFEAQIAAEENDFDLGDVARVLNEKLIRRHPHVFADKEVDNPDQVLKNWDAIKEQEKEVQDIQPSLVDKLDQGQTALNQAYQIQKIAAKVGFDWKNLTPVLDKIEEELAECKEIMGVLPDNSLFSNQNKVNSEIDNSLVQAELESEIGDLLFAVVNLARFKKINPEVALVKTILKFKSRFKYIERKVAKNSSDFKNYNLAELDEFWNQAKKNE
jgi:tetrapyrrole methylase family protein/MazG family protein